jgi:ribosomal protein L29
MTPEEKKEALRQLKNEIANLRCRAKAKANR